MPLERSLPAPPALPATPGSALATRTLSESIPLTPPVPALNDDGRTVTLDLHGTTVREAKGLADALLRAAAERGRSSVKLIHGTSTSDPRYRNRTIKHAVQDLADSHPLVTTALRAEGHLTCSLDVTAPPDPAPLTLRDIAPGGW